jgi:DNA integrity scanning protein DisA with diadenylate cyclase activity
MILLDILKELPKFTIIDFVDIVLVAVLLFFLFKLLKGTNAISIVVGFFILYIVWKVVSLLGMTILSEIFGQFISLVVLALIICSNLKYVNSLFL